MNDSLRSESEVSPQEYNEEDSHQQQIIFDDLDNKKNMNEELSAKAVFFDNQAWKPIDDKKNQESILLTSYAANLKRKPKPRWIWRTIGALSSILIITELVDFFTIGFSSSPIMASIYAILLV
jgi:putative membrane protein